MNFTKLFVGTLALSAMLAACVDDSTSAKDTDRSEEVYSDLVVETFDDLPVCSDNREGATAYVKDEKNAYMCVDGDWVPEEENSSSSIASSSSTIRNDNSSSSSETTQSSSSSENISAGSVYDATAKTLTDLRDGQTYKTVTIGDQVWMAENLNYAYTDVPYEYNGYTSDSTSWCYNNDPSNCSKYGRLYTWVAATTVCPSGWHLPSTTEWKTLFTAVGGSSTAGTVLKSTGGWYNDGNGTDAFGFSALPAGCKYSLGDYDYEGSQAYFWSSSEDGSDYAYNMLLDYYGDNVRLLNTSKSLGFSVRCLKD